MPGSIEGDRNDTSFSYGRFAAGIGTGLTVVAIGLAAISLDRPSRDTERLASGSADRLTVQEQPVSTISEEVADPESPTSNLAVEPERILITPDPAEAESEPAKADAAPSSSASGSLPKSRLPQRASPEMRIALNREDPTRLAFKVPKRSEQRLEPAWKRNAIPFEAPTDLPLIAVILEAPNESSIPQDLIFGIGVPITMSVVPRSSQEAAFGASARAAGFEVMARLPMQDQADPDPSSELIHPGLSAPEVQDLTRRFLARLPVAVGATQFGSRSAAQNLALMRALINELDSGGYVYVDETGRSGAVAAVARGGEVPTVDDVKRISAGLTDEQVYRLLEGAAQAAQQQGAVVVSAATERSTLIGLQRWALEKNGKTARLAPLTAVLSRL